MAVPIWLQRTYWTLAGCGLVYVLAVLSLTVPAIQRNATYAHNVPPVRWHNLSNVEQFGFLQHQVQPFTITTPDNVTLFAWHILPIHLYKKHQQKLREQPEQLVEPYDKASSRVGLQLLLNDPSALLITSFHGNAGHLGFAQRSATYQNFLGLSTVQKPLHVIAFDYRGFGLSTGSPTEEGVILDAISVLSAITGYGSTPPLSAETPARRGAVPSKGVDPSRIILIGQSLGTFVSTSLYHAWTLELQRPAFKGLFLMASFTSLEQLLGSYSIKGLSPPLLSPLLGYPRAQKWLMSKLIDKWETARRLTELVKAPDVPLDLTIMHARDDWEIPWREGRGNWNAIMDAVGERERSEEAIATGSETLNLQTWQSRDSTKSVRWERVAHGGHNRIPTSEQAKLAILRLIDGE